MGTDQGTDVGVLQSKRDATRYQILVELAERQPAVSQQEVADAIGVTAQAVSDYLQELVDEGYVDKRSQDDRTNLYHLTEEGRTVLTEELEWRIGKLVAGDRSVRYRVERVVKDGPSGTEPADVNGPV